MSLEKQNLQNCMITITQQQSKEGDQHSHMSVHLTTTALYHSQTYTKTPSTMLEGGH